MTVTETSKTPSTSTFASQQLQLQFDEWFAARRLETCAAAPTVLNPDLAAQWSESPDIVNALRDTGADGIRQRVTLEFKRDVWGVKYGGAEYGYGPRPSLAADKTYCDLILKRDADIALNFEPYGACPRVELIFSAKHNNWTPDITLPNSADADAPARALLVCAQGTDVRLRVYCPPEDAAESVFGVSFDVIYLQHPHKLELTARQTVMNAPPLAYECGGVRVVDVKAPAPMLVPMPPVRTSVVVIDSEGNTLPLGKPVKFQDGVCATMPGWGAKDRTIEVDETELAFAKTIMMSYATGPVTYVCDNSCYPLARARTFMQIGPGSLTLSLLYNSVTLLSPTGEALRSYVLTQGKSVTLMCVARDSTGGGTLQIME